MLIFEQANIVGSSFVYTFSLAFFPRMICLIYMNDIIDWCSMFKLPEHLVVVNTCFPWVYL